MRTQQESSHSWWRFVRQGNSALLPWHQPIGDLWTLWTVPSAPDRSKDWSGVYRVCHHSSFDTFTPSVFYLLPTLSTPVSYLCGLGLSWAWQGSGQQVEGQQVCVGNSLIQKHFEHTQVYTPQHITEVFLGSTETQTRPDPGPESGLESACVWTWWVTVLFPFASQEYFNFMPFYFYIVETIILI